MLFIEGATGIELFIVRVNAAFSRGKDWRGRRKPVPKRSGGMEQERNPAKPGFCDYIAKSRPNDEKKETRDMQYNRRNY